MTFENPWRLKEPWPTDYLIIPHSVWARIVRLFANEHGWTEEELVEAIREGGWIEDREEDDEEDDEEPTP